MQSHAITCYTCGKMQLYSRPERHQGRRLLPMICLALLLGVEHSQERHSEGRKDEGSPGRGRSVACCLCPSSRTGRRCHLACVACCTDPGGGRGGLVCLTGRPMGETEEAYPAWLEGPEESWGSQQSNATKYNKTQYDAMKYCWLSSWVALNCSWFDLYFILCDCSLWLVDSLPDWLWIAGDVIWLDWVWMYFILLCCIVSPFLLCYVVRFACVFRNKYIKLQQHAITCNRMQHNLINYHMCML